MNNVLHDDVPMITEYYFIIKHGHCAGAKTIPADAISMLDELSNAHDAFNFQASQRAT
jgi:hypothetical protein